MHFELVLWDVYQCVVFEPSADEQDSPILEKQVQRDGIEAPWQKSLHDRHPN
jgi:hypothetical protein